MATVPEDLASRGAPLEYWFVRFNAGVLAFLVDFIIRRASGQAEVRVSLWVRGQGRVARDSATTWSAATWSDTGPIRVGNSLIDAVHSTGAVDDIEWDLRYEPRAGRAAPRVPLLSRLQPFDLELVSRPCVDFSGTVTVSGERFDVADSYGCLTHYWGRRLPDRWRWISANEFGDTGLAVEAVVMATRLWGRRPSLSAGYLWTQQDGRQEMLISPANGIITVTGDEADYLLTARRPGSTTRLRCAAEADRYNDLGEGIRQTLHGSCTLVESALTDPRAGLEYRTNWTGRTSGPAGQGGGRSILGR